MEGRQIPDDDDDGDGGDDVVDADHHLSASSSQSSWVRWGAGMRGGTISCWGEADPRW